MGIGEAERHWKANKKIRGGQRAKLSPENAKMQATIAANHSMERSALRRDRAMQAGMLWDDKDFETCKLGENVVFHFVLLVTILHHLHYCCTGLYCDENKTMGFLSPIARQHNQQSTQNFTIAGAGTHTNKRRNIKVSHIILQKLSSNLIAHLVCVQPPIKPCWRRTRHHHSLPPAE